MKYLMTLTLPFFMLVGCVRRPTITGSKNDDFHITATFYKDVTSIEVWDYETNYLLWQVGQGRLNTGFCGVDLNYGTIPKGMRQYFPITEHYEPLPVRDLKEDQQIYLLIAHIDDKFMAPGRGEVAALFIHNQGKLNYIRGLDKSELQHLSQRSGRRRRNSPRCKSYQQRDQFIKKVEDEISLNKPLFITESESTIETEVTETIERLKGYVDRTETTKAYIDLRAKTNISLYKQTPPIKDIRVFRDLKNLKSLDLEDNKISNIAPLKSLQELSDVNLKGNPIGDFSPLGKISKLKWLNLANTGVTNFQWLSNASKLFSLKIAENGLTDNTDFSHLKKLKIKRLDISRNQLRNANSLKSFPHLDSLIILSNPLESLDFISHMKKLRLVEIGLSTELDLSPLIDHFIKHQIKASQVTLCGDKSLLDSKQLKQLEKIVTVHFRNYK